MQKGQGGGSDNEDFNYSIEAKEYPKVQDHHTTLEPEIKK